MSESQAKLASALADRYEIERELGRGGMATVFLARDLKHHRHVAIKVLRSELAAVIGAERFLAEIRTTANLQHPHILPLHDSGEVDGTAFFVMPYVEGRTLRDRISHEKQLPVEDAVLIAREVASALDYAHRRGVVHRDIKPENILLHDGRALVADFGIALALSRSDGGTRMTETGISLGTPQYMAPEQAMGERDITPQADVYALGCVLYEMLVGEPPFTAPTAQAIVTRAMTESPRPIAPQRHTVAPHIEAAILRALERVPADRTPGAAAFAAALAAPSQPADRLLATARAPTGSDRRMLVTFGVVAAVATSLAGWSLSRSTPDAQVAHYPLAFAADEQPNPDFPIDISPDGSMIAYAGSADAGAVQVWIKRRDRETPSPLPGTGSVISFTFSPDSRSLAYITLDGQLRTYSFAGGNATTVAAGADALWGVAWLDDMTIVFPAPGGRVLQRVPADGGPIDTIADLRASPEAREFLFPVALPGSRGVLVLDCRGGARCLGGANLIVIDLESGEERLVGPQGIRGQFATTGAVVYADVNGRLLTVDFDPRSLRTRGPPALLPDTVALGANAYPQFALSRRGTSVRRRGGDPLSTAYELVWVSRNGGEQAVDSAFRFRPTIFGSNVGWSLSPDGSRVAIGINSASVDAIWVKQMPTGPVSRLTLDSLAAFRPRWSRDGRWIYFHALQPDGTADYRRVSSLGTGRPERVLGTPAGPGIFEAAWAADGRTLVLRAGGVLGTTGGRDLFIATPGADSTIHPLIAEPNVDESGIALSPDGRWILYESNETGRIEVYVRQFPDVGAGKWQVSVDGGRAPLWARNGRELFYVNGARALVAMSFEGTGSTPGLGTRTPLFTMRRELYLAAQENYTPFDVSPDGQRFLMARVPAGAATRARPLVVTENWLTELRERIPR